MPPYFSAIELSGSCAANQKLHIATQHNIFIANQEYRSSAQHLCSQSGAIKLDNGTAIARVQTR
jgi:hypothetical protein